ACPWGILAKVTADALSFYGYQTKICWVCWSSYGPREMGDRTKPVMPPASQINDPEYVEPPPDLVPDLSATSESNLIDAWNGTGPYASDGKTRRNYRVIAVIRTTTYMLAAASRKSGITSLAQIKDRRAPTWIVGGNQIIFDYYGIKTADLQAKGGGIMPSVGPGPGKATREKRASGDVFIGTGLLANTPEQRSWYEASQLNDLVFLDFDEPLIAKLAQEPGYERAAVPLALFRGVDRPIPTVMRPNHLIYVRDDAPDDFAYTVAKALDEHRDLFQVQLEPWYYDPRTVAESKIVPLHPGALKYYRERGYIK
ncbi:MAG TPA: TAXI family TRAP transporter solute-binding subunit, partial [Vicinamibacterales bacterium]